jgi:CRP/FNR family cyclic AMP-dependent transcriptional regulator
MIVTTPALFKALASIPVLAGTTEQAQLLVAEEGLVRSYAPGEWIVREGDEGHAFLLVEGEVEVIKHADAPHAVLLERLKVGSTFGEMCVLGPMRRVASIRAAGAVRVIQIPAATLHHLYLRLPDQYAIVLLNLARDLARRLEKLDEAFAARC